MNHPNIINAYDLARGDYNDCQTTIGGGFLYVPARPMAPTWHRWKATWLVFTGKADALIWPGQENRS